MMTAEDLAEMTFGAMVELPSLDSVPDDETREIIIVMADYDRWDDGPKFGHRAFLGVPTDPFIEVIDEEIEPVVDKRRCPADGDVEIGIMTVKGDGEILSVEIEETYLKPSEK